MKKTLLFFLSIMFFAYSCSSDDKDDIISKTDTFVITSNVTVTDNLPDDNYALYVEVPNDKLVSYDTQNKDVEVIKGEKETVIILTNTTFSNFNFTFKTKDFNPNFGLNLNVDNDDEPEEVNIKLTGKVIVTKNNSAYIDQTFNLDYLHPTTVLEGKKN